MCESKQRSPRLDCTLFLSDYREFSVSKKGLSELGTRDRSTTAERERNSFRWTIYDHIAASVSCCVVDWGYQGAARSARESPKKSPKKAPVS